MTLLFKVIEFRSHEINMTFSFSQVKKKRLQVYYKLFMHIKVLKTSLNRLDC